MNYFLILITFLAVNLDFFFILLFLLERYRTIDVMIGYVIGIVLLLIASFFIGKALSLFMPEWLLGALGVLPIYMALHDNDGEEDTRSKQMGPVLTTFVTYLAVCSGCNLAIFLPVVANESYGTFGLTMLFILFLSAGAVVLIKRFGSFEVVKRVMNRYGEQMMKVIYIGVGLYVFYDSGLISHLLNLL